MINKRRHGRWVVIDYGSSNYQAAVAVEDSAMALHVFYCTGSLIIYKDHTEKHDYRRIM